MQVETTVREIPIDSNLPAELEKIAKDGWILVPGKTPMATYHLMRVTHEAAGAGFGKLHIDDSKVGILKPDGTMQ